MLDRFKREISYLRISVTDRCNLRCTYCMPAEGIELMSHDDILTLEQIAEVVKVGAEKFGIVITSYSIHYTKLYEKRRGDNRE